MTRQSIPIQASHLLFHVVQIMDKGMNCFYRNMLKLYISLGVSYFAIYLLISYFMEFLDMYLYVILISKIYWHMVLKNKMFSMHRIKK